VADVDGDDVRCRWAESSLGECAGVCRAFTGSTLVGVCTVKISVIYTLDSSLMVLVIVISNEEMKCHCIINSMRRKFWRAHMFSFYAKCWIHVNSLQVVCHS